MHYPFPISTVGLAGTRSTLSPLGIPPKTILMMKTVTGTARNSAPMPKQCSVTYSATIEKK